MTVTFSGARAFRHRNYQLFFGGQLAMRRRCRMNDEAAHIADVRDVAVQLERLDELLPGFEPALQVEEVEDVRNWSSVMRSTFRRVAIWRRR